MENLDLLVRELVRLPTETPWVEFKHNNGDPKTIGEDISALANAAALNEKSYAYMIWGVDDTTYEIIGTDFNFRTKKIGGEELENWLRHQLSENANFEFNSVKIDEKPLVVLIICKAIVKTVMFEKVDFIKVGSYTKN